MTNKRKNLKELYDGECVRVWSSNCSLIEQKNTSILRKIGHRISAAFVPEAKTSEDYYHFQVWDSLQGLCSYIRGMLSSQAILKGILTEQSGAQTAAGSAVYTYFMRDISGMIGGIAFAALQGSGMDSFAKQWRIFADCFNNVGYILELISPLFPSAFLLLACLGSIARAITGVAAGATRSALTYHFARDGNAGDISAKEGSQETAVTLLGMSIGMLVVHLAGGSWIATWLAFIVLTVLHIYANVKAMRSLNLSSLNRPRLDLILRSYLNNRTVLSIEDVAKLESLLAPPLQLWLSYFRGKQEGSIILGACFSDLDDQGRQCLSNSRGTAYFCWPYKGRDVLVVLSPAASKEQLLRAYVDAWVMRASLQDDSKLAAGFMQDWLSFAEAATRAGWDLDSLSLGESKWRVAWGGDLHHE